MNVFAFVIHAVVAFGIQEFVDLAPLQPKREKYSWVLGVGVVVC